MIQGLCAAEARANLPGPGTLLQTIGIVTETEIGTAIGIVIGIGIRIVIGIGIGEASVEEATEGATNHAQRLIPEAGRCPNSPLQVHWAACQN